MFDATITSNDKIIFILKKSLLAIVIFLSIALNNSVSANDLYFVVNGLSHHTKTEPGRSYNEKNTGFGLQYDYNKMDKQLVPFINIGGFYDSNNNPSYYIGSGIMHRTSLYNRSRKLNIDAGMTMFFMSRENLGGPDKGNGVILGALPALTIGTEEVAINITYIPELDIINTSVWFFQLKLKIDSF